MMRWNELHYPNILSVASLPKEFIMKAVDELKKSMQYHYSPVQERFLEDMVNSLNSITPTNTTCDNLYKWHKNQEDAYWPNFKLKFADLWLEYR
jgi:hypothetical protein